MPLVVNYYNMTKLLKIEVYYIKSSPSYVCLFFTHFINQLFQVHLSLCVRYETMPIIYLLNTMCKVFNKKIIKTHSCIDVYKWRG